MKKLFVIILSLTFLGCSSNRSLTDEVTQITTTPKQINATLDIEFVKGKFFNHPSFAIWVEDLEGNYIETLFVTKSVGSGVFAHGELETGRWKNEPGAVRRPAALPYWSHKRNVLAPDGLFVPSPETSVPDALTAATPTNNFHLRTGTKYKSNQKFRVLFEINQPWDSNKYWSNDKFPDDKDYFTSLQPSLVYAATIGANPGETKYILNPIGHGQPSGKDGKLYTDLTTLTTAKEIAQNISVTLK